uniref:Phosphoesterase n=1 Tax=Pantoea phage Survivor TaxID=3232176 RepID=A0AAU8KZR8_9CAUD
MNHVLWADLHIDHLSSAKHRGFETLKDYQECVAEAWCKNVTPRTDITIVGDAALYNDGLLFIKKLPARRKILVLGNHDKERGNDIRDILEVFDDVHGLQKVDKHRIWIQHCPMHISQLRGGRNIHGHSHRDIIKDERYINVCWDLLQNGPVDFEAILTGEYKSYRAPETNVA